MKFMNIRRHFDTFYNILQGRNAKILPSGKSQDISSLEQQLNQKTTYKQLFENYPEGIAMLDNSYRIITVNQGFETLFGYPLEEIKGQNLYDLIVPDLLRNELTETPYSLLTEKTPKNEYICKKDDGTYLYISMMSVPLMINHKQSGFYMIFSDITDRKKIEEKLLHFGIYDSLTGLYNRTFFQEQMKNYDMRLAEAGIIVCDLNGLKIINDSFGHQVGDSLLMAAANILSSSLRTTDIVARIGGDEFAILLPFASKLEIEIICQRIRKGVSDYNDSSPTAPLSIAMGYAVAHDTITTNMADLFKEADNNMYREKASNTYKTRQAIVNSFMSSLETKDYIKDGHLDRLKTMVQNVTKTFPLPEDVQENLLLLAKYHDIGKISIPEAILFKKNSLNTQEIKELERHSEIGSRIANSISDFIPIGGLILKHHEKWDGSGYPLGLSGESIPLECRIFALADAYDAMVTFRPYRKPIPKTKAINEIKKCAGTHFDPVLVEPFINALNL